MPNQQLLIHSGYPKTASTWLKNVLFKEEAGFMTPWGYRVPTPKPPLKWIMACKASAEIEKIIPPEMHKRLDKYWQNYVAEQVGDYFRNSNQQTSQLIGKNLADFGYNC